MGATARRPAQIGWAMPVKDSMIPATALDLAIVTRNRSDFEKAGVEVVDPFIPGR
jgi:predicted nucleic acid-binding protein